MITFKKYENKDLNNCINQLIYAFSKEPWNESWTHEQAKTRISEIMGFDVSRGYLAYVKDTLVGMACGKIIKYLDYNLFFVDEFSVNPDYQRQGIGSKLLDFIYANLKTEHISLVVLNTESGYPSIDFYQANGFVVDHEVGFYYLKTAKHLNNTFACRKCHQDDINNLSLILTSHGLSHQRSHEIINHLAHNSDYFFCTLANNKPVGFIAGKFITYLTLHQFWIEQFFIHKDFQQQGYGSSLLHHISHHLYENSDITYMIIQTKKQSIMHRFLEKHHFLTDDVVFMKRNLD